MSPPLPPPPHPGSGADVVTPDALLRAALAADPARPLLSFYDDGSGERVELSVATVENWVAKTANLLVDGLAVEPGARVALLLPLHWQAAVWLSACWAAGVVAWPDGDPGTADVVVAGPDRLAEAAGSGALDVVGLSLAPLGARLPDPPAGVTDYAEVLTYGDRFVAPDPPGADTPALTVEGTTWTAGALTAEAVAAAGRWGLGAGDRVLTTLPYDRLDATLAGLLAPLAAGAGVVQCRHLDPEALAGRVTDERVTALVGVEAPGGSDIPALSVRS